MQKMFRALNSQYSQFIKDFMEVRKQKNYMDKPSRKSNTTNQPSGKTGKLTKPGQVYRNDLLDTDLTSQIATRRKLKGV